ncbi:MAG: HAMP domain-containing sensor histidine kinase [Candidatus Altiarchaeota archaeon]
MVETKTSGKYESLRDIRDRFRNLPEPKTTDQRISKVAADISETLVRGLEGKSGEEIARILKVWEQPGFKNWIGTNPELLLTRYLVGENWEKYSHNLKNIMTGVQGGVWMIQELSSPGSKYAEKQTPEERLRRVNDTANDVMQFVGDVWTVVQSMNIAMAAGKTTRKEDVNVNELLKRPYKASIHSALIQEDRLEPRWKLDKELPKIRTDPTLLEAVLINVFMNSAHAMENTKEKKLHMKTSREGNFAKIEIKDSGYGFNPEEKVNQEGEPDPRGKQTKKEWIMGLFNTTKGPRGTGMGLFISNSVITTLGGTFDINSEGKGKGATVTIKLPVTQTTRQ